MVGTTISHYKVIEKIGQGGMGEVYRAQDTKLGREVAIKVLPDLFAQDRERLARFEREAKLLASLNHPNIAAIYGLEETDGVRFLVLELVEGETLAERVAKGPLPVEEALEICRQIAEGVEAAHEKGVIHRDLKPANVKITPEGMVKVLDFGLAKALEGERPVTDISQSPTLTDAMTRSGVILGTAAYMSPEQARGKRVDKRADIWAFGCVLYELLTGKRPFEGETITETLAGILKGEPGWEVLSENTPWRVRDLLHRCLQKHPHDRLRDIGDARIEIKKALSDPATVSPIGVISAAQPARWKRAIPWGVAGLITVVLLISLVGLWQAALPVDQPLMRLKVELTPSESLWTDIGASAVLSPDGAHLAYVIGSGTSGQLYLRKLDQLEATLLSGTESAYHPFFSPDGQWVAFFTPRELKKVSVFGGAPLTLCDVSRNRGGSWGPDDTIIFAPTPNSALSRVPALGGTPEQLTVLDEGEYSHRWPYVLPGGRAVLFTAHTSGRNFDDANIEVLILETGERKVLHQGGFYARYVPSGHLVYVREGTLFTAPFDLDRVELTGPPAPILEGILSNSSWGGAQFAFSQTGTLVYLAGTSRGGEYSMLWIDRQGAVSSLSGERRRYFGPRFSPDGGRLALQIDSESNQDVWVYEIEREAMTRLTFDEAADGFPIWSPDGQQVAFSSDRDGGQLNLYRKPADGSREAERLSESKNNQVVTSWSPDGNFLAFNEESPETGWDIWVLPLEGDRKPELFLGTRFAEVYPEFSPDGRWIAYMSNESGRMEIYVRPFPGPGGKWQISTEGGRLPRWSPDGRELFYRNGNKMIAVAVRSEGESLRAGKPRQLFEGSFPSLYPYPDYDITPDGKRFVMFKMDTEKEEAAFTHLNFVLNWFEELKRLVPTAK
ncbi:protein kinase [Acidobacteria bacterium AH-259-G07]|nr:protein kinase [Acidobacteria bacterium AH-259-G07]